MLEKPQLTSPSSWNGEGIALRITTGHSLCLFTLPKGTIHPTVETVPGNFFQIQRNHHAREFGEAKRISTFLQMGAVFYL